MFLQKGKVLPVKTGGYLRAQTRPLCLAKYAFNFYKDCKSGQLCSAEVIVKNKGSVKVSEPLLKCPNVHKASIEKHQV